MKLYAWQPKGHGPMSLFVVAANEEDARDAIRKHVATLEESERYFYQSWDSDTYTLTVAEPGQVLENGND